MLKLSVFSHFEIFIEVRISCITPRPEIMIFGGYERLFVVMRVRFKRLLRGVRCGVELAIKSSLNK